MTPKQFYDHCKNLDWFSSMSDDHSVYLAGERALDKTLKLTALSNEHNRIFNEWKDHMYSGAPWETEKKPVPIAPQEQSDPPLKEMEK